MSGLTIGSLFTGAGMLDRAVEQTLGAQTIWRSDIKPAAIETIRPRLVIWENFRGALSACAESSSDSDAAWQCLSAASVGACHERYRVFIVAWSADSHPVDLGFDRRRLPPSSAERTGSPRQTDRLGKRRPHVRTVVA